MYVTFLVLQIVSLNFLSIKISKFCGAAQLVVQTLSKHTKINGRMAKRAARVCCNEPRAPHLTRHDLDLGVGRAGERVCQANR